MRSTIFILLLSAAAFGQTTPDRAIEREFEKLLRLIEAPEAGREVTEDQAQQRATQFRNGIKGFVGRWRLRASELGPGLFTLGRGLAMAGQPAEAAQIYERFVKTQAPSPNHDEARVAWGASLLDAGKTAEAEAVLQTYLADPATKGSARQVVAEYYLALVKIERAANEAALALLEGVVNSGSEAPVVADAHLKRIEVLRDLQRIDEARAALDVLRRENPDSPYLELLAEQLAWFGRAAPALQNIDGWVQGEATSLADLTGKVVVLNFFALRYEACQVELGQLAGLAKELAAKDVVFIGVTKDYIPYDRVPKDRQRADLVAGLQKLKVPFRVAIAKDFASLKAYEVRGIPHTVIIGRDGKVRHLKVGSSERDRRAKLDFEAALRREL